MLMKILQQGMFVNVRLLIYETKRSVVNQSENLPKIVLPYNYFG